jgi:hypothetical protein
MIGRIGAWNKNWKFIFKQITNQRLKSHVVFTKLSENQKFSRYVAPVVPYSAMIVPKTVQIQKLNTLMAT